MKKMLCAMAVMLTWGVEGMNGVGLQPCITYNTNSGTLMTKELKNIDNSVFQNMPYELIQMFIQLGELAKNAVTNQEFDDEKFTEKDAFWAINGAKMDLKNVITNSPNDSALIVKRALSTIIDCAGFKNVLGYKYCLAILLIHFSNELTDDLCLQLFNNTIKDKSQYGFYLMQQAEKGDDGDATLYLQCN